MITKAAQEAILMWASKNPVVEVTGFVEQLGHAQLVVPMQNVSRTPETDYRWDEREMARVFDVMHNEGGECIAYYHSHPNGRREPSEVDMQAALQPGMMYLIAYPDGTRWTGKPHWHLSAWECIEQGILIEASL